MKILTVLGARPQFVKAAVVSRAIASLNGTVNNSHQIREIIVHTGQHYDPNMSDVFFREMKIPDPDYNLGINSSYHGAMTGRMLEQIESVLFKEKVDIVLVYGDTNSTLAGALAAAKLHIPVAHVEAGLRSFNMNMPEEINRILTDRVSRFLFCPTETAVNNLSNEGIVNDAKLFPKSPIVINVGDVMFDAVLFYSKISEPSRAVSEHIKSLNSEYYLMTMHRAENTDDYSRLKEITEAINMISETTPVVLPLHPRTKKMLNEHNLNFKRALIIDPVGYFDMLALLENCNAVFTDSGGLQKEAYFSSKPCITLRDETEWVELVDGGYNVLVGAVQGRIVEAEKNLNIMNNDYTKELYGRGDAGEQIIKSLINLIN